MTVPDVTGAQPPDHTEGSSTQSWYPPTPRWHTKVQLPEPIVCLVTDRRMTARGSLVQEIVDAVGGGVNMVQVREKDLPTRQLLDLVIRLRDTACDKALLIVNGRPDVAFAAGADGVHLPSDGMLPSQARLSVGPDVLVGRSVHRRDEIEELRAEPIDYVELGTVFPSRSHPGGVTCGLKGVRAAAELGVPVLAIGGITSENAAQVVKAGARGVAVITAILGQPRPREAARRLVDAVYEAWARRSPTPAVEIARS